MAPPRRGRCSRPSKRGNEPSKIPDSRQICQLPTMGAEVSTNGEEGSAEDAAPTKLQAALEKAPAPTWQTGAAANAPTPRETSGATLDGAGLFVIAGRGKAVKG